VGALDGIYPHANTIVCIEDSKLLKQFHYDILYNAEGLQGALDELNKMNYFHTYKNADAYNYSSVLDSLMKDTFELMRNIVPDESIWRIFALYYDIHNMKLAVKERLTGKKLDSLVLVYGSYSLPTIRSAAVRESDNLLKNETLTKGYFKALHTKDMYDIDFILDKAYFETLKGYAVRLNSPGIVEFVIERIDLFNISALFQSMAAGASKAYFAKAFSEEGSCSLSQWQEYIYGDPGEAEKFPLREKYRPIWSAAENRQRLFEELDVLIDNYLIGKTKACKLMAFGIEPIAAYFYNKLIEIKNIRILLTGKERGYVSYEIQRRMRIPYEL